MIGHVPACTYLDDFSSALVEGGNVVVDESPLGLLGLVPCHGQQLTATLVLLQCVTVPPTYTYVQDG